MINQSVPRFTTQHTYFEKKIDNSLRIIAALRYKATAFVKCFLFATLAVFLPTMHVKALLQGLNLAKQCGESLIHLGFYTINGCF